MSAEPILLVSFTVDQESEAEFNDFYHHVYIPAFLRVIPECRSVRRYSSADGSGQRQYLTLHEFASADVVEAGIAALERRGRESEQSRFHEFENTHLHDVSSIVYRQTFCHPRVPSDGAWGLRPMYLVTYQVRPEQEQAFSTWYETEYISRLMADVVGYVACRRYASQNADPPTRLTVYEIASMPEVEQALADMGSPWRSGENKNWHHWEEAAVPEIDARVFRPIFQRGA